MQKRHALAARASSAFEVKPLHVVGDLRALPGPTHDDVTGAEVTINEVDMVICGFACTDISLMKTKRISFNEESPGVSSITFWGCVKLIAVWMPAIVILENTLGLMWKRSCDDGKRLVESVTLACAYLCIFVFLSQSNPSLL